MESPNSTNNQNIEMDYIRLAKRCLKRWYWFAGMVFVALAAAVLYVCRTNKVYSTSATIMLRNEDKFSRGNSMQNEMMSMMGFNMNKNVTDEIEIITSHTIMSEVIHSLNLQTEYRRREGLRWVTQYPTPDLIIDYPAGFMDTLSMAILFEVERTSKGYTLHTKAGKSKQKLKLASLDSEIHTLIGDIRLLEVVPLEEGDRYRITTAPTNLWVNSYRTNFSCSQLKKESNVILIDYEDQNPARGKDVVSKVIEFYNLDAVIDKNLMAQNTANFINDRLIVVEEELSSVENEVEAYMKENNLTDIDKELQQVFTNQTSYQQQMTEIEMQISILSFIEQYLNEEANNESLIPSNMGIQDAGLAKLITEYNSLMLNRMRLRRSATEQSPILVQSAQQLELMRTAILSSVQQIKHSQKITRSELERKESQFAHLIKQVPEKERHYVEIKRQQEIKEKLYIFLYQKREENALTLASSVVPAKIIDAPLTAIKPVSPKKKQILLIALIIGLGIPFGIIFMLEYFNDTVRDKKEFQATVKAPFLGQIIQSSGSSRIVVSRHSNTVQSELFRTIRTNLRFMLPTDHKPIILVSSAMNGEGKSFVTINTALSLALLGKRVCLVGLDIRKPTLNTYMNLDFKGNLTSYLSDTSVSVNDLIKPSGLVEGLDVCPAGVIPPNPGELIQNGRLSDLFAELRLRYDMIIVDSAPVMLVSDTYHIAKYADLTIFVTRANYLSRVLLPQIQEIYEQNLLPNMACVLNGINSDSKGYGYGSYGHNYGYGYGHGYAKEEHGWLYKLKEHIFK